MDTREAGRMGGLARVAAMTPAQLSAAMRHARAALTRKQTALGDAKRRAKAKRRKVEKMRAASRKANR